MKRIAVVEDNSDNRLLISLILEGSYAIEEYESGVDALQAFTHTVPDLVLLDISLPVMDGLEVLRHIRTTPTLQQLPVIAFTAHASAHDRHRFMAAGFTDYITKPILDERILLAAIAKQIG